MSFFDKILECKRSGNTYVIAEVGSNWSDEVQLKDAIQLAKNCGADAVKFQYLDPSELYGPVAKINPDFPLSRLKVKADAVGIDLICSAFSAEGVKEVDRFVEAHKVASSEMSHIRILKAIKDTGKPVILSTGGYFLTDIKRVLNFFGADYPIILMHCNLAYPAKFTDIKKFLSLQEGWQGVIGYSDHTTNIDVVPVAYKNFGATVIEKHFNPFDLKGTPDAPHSLNKTEFKTMVSYLRGTPSDMTEENEARLMHVRRVIAIRDIKAGELLKEGENMGIFRSKKPDENGANPFVIDRLEGKMVNKPIASGDGISLMDVN